LKAGDSIRSLVTVAIHVVKIHDARRILLSTIGAWYIFGCIDYLPLEHIVFTLRLRLLRLSLWTGSCDSRPLVDVLGMFGSPFAVSRISLFTMSFRVFSLLGAPDVRIFVRHC